MPKPIPARLRPFGRRYISLTSLNRNKLSLTTQSKAVCLRFEVISDKLRDVVKSILLGTNLETLDEDVSELSAIDRKILAQAMQEAQISNSFDLEVDHNKNKLIARYNVLRDEVLTGNNSKELLKEFSETMDELKSKKLLSLTDYNRLRNIISKAILED